MAQAVGRVVLGFLIYIGIYHNSKTHACFISGGYRASAVPVDDATFCHTN